MINFNVGAKRLAGADARATAAKDLVQRTLAQHGLLPNGALGSGPVQDLMSRMSQPLNAAAPVTPQGASFERAQFSCAAGSRAYLTYVPASAAQGVAGIVVMLHGCTQTPEDFAIGTGMNALAEQHRLVVVYPQQSRGDNAQSCWNWFSRGDQKRDRGEPAIIAGLSQEVMAKFDVPRERTFVAGLSAGAAMAVILGETYQDIFAAVGAHSGLPFGAAHDVPSAFAAMAGRAAEPVSCSTNGTPPRTIVFHGSADATVAPVNGDRIARQTLERGPRQTLCTDERGQASGRQFNRQIVTDPEGLVVLEHWVIDGLGHAWVGGQPQGSYTDAKGPDASAEMVRFFLQHPEKSQR